MVSPTIELYREMVNEEYTTRRMIDQLKRNLSSMYFRVTESVKAGDTLVYNPDGTASPLKHHPRNHGMSIQYANIVGVAMFDSQRQGGNRIAPHRVKVGFRNIGHLTNTLSQINYPYPSVKDILKESGYTAETYDKCYGHGSKFTEPQVDPLCSVCKELWNDASD